MEARLFALLSHSLRLAKKLGKKGVVREKSTHKEVIDTIISFVLENGFSVKGISFSPVKGPEGNIEYLIFLKKTENPALEAAVDTSALVEESHRVLNGGSSS